MPTYEYQCDACQHNFDEFQMMSDKPLRKCPKCGKLKLRRVFGAGAAILFKGSGFYQTDYRSDSYHKAAKADKESSGKTSDGSSKTSDSSTSAASDSAGSAKRTTDTKKSESKNED